MADRLGGPTLHVLLVLGSSTGGVGTHVRSLAARLPAACAADGGARVVVAGPDGTDERFGFSLAGAGFVPVRIAAAPRPPADAAAVLRLRALARGADVVHAHGLRAAALTGLALGRRRAGRVPLVATWHNAVLATGVRGRLLARLAALAARRADVTLGASSDLVEQARELGSPDARLAPVAAPPVPATTRSRAQVRRTLGLADDQPLVLAVGRLAPQKDYPTLLAAAARLRALDARAVVAVAGDGPLHGALASQIAEQHLPVRLLGRRGDVADLLAAADLLVVSSTWEARALVVQEAVRAGTPVVATAVGGIPELVLDGARLVPAGDPAALAAAMTGLLADPAERAQLAARATAVAETWPDEDATAAQVAAVYAELCGVRRVGRPG